MLNQSTADGDAHGKHSDKDEAEKNSPGMGTYGPPIELNHFKDIVPDQQDLFKPNPSVETFGKNRR